MSGIRTLNSPLSADEAGALRAGDEVLLSGVVYTARDAAHARMCALIREGKPLPVDLQGQTVYYAGPTPAKPGMASGSVGPTTSGRMDSFTPLLLEKAGLRAMIGKGDRSLAVREAMVRCGSVYFAAIGGAAAILGRCVVSVEVVCWADLGAEAVRRMVVREMPVVVVIDSLGTDLYEEGPKRWRVGGECGVSQGSQITVEWSNSH